MNDYIEINMNDKICLDSYFKKYIKKIIEYLNKENTKGAKGSSGGRLA